MKRALTWSAGIFAGVLGVTAIAVIAGTVGGSIVVAANDNKELKQKLLQGLRPDKVEE